MKTISKSLLRKLALVLGIFSIVISMTIYHGIETYTKLIFHIVLLTTYTLFAKKIKPLFYVFYVSAMAVDLMDSTTLFSIKFFWFLLGYSICFLSGIMLLIPLLKKGKLKFKGVNLVFLLVILAVLGYIIFSMYLTFLGELDFNNCLFFTIAALLFTVFVIGCFYIIYSNNHPKSVFLFLTGIGYGIISIAGLIAFLYQVDNVLLKGLLNLGECLVQFCFVFFMIDFEEVLNNKDFISLED